MNPFAPALDSGPLFYYESWGELLREIGKDLSLGGVFLRGPTGPPRVVNPGK